jgi:hypothetical protein
MKWIFGLLAAVSSLFSGADSKLQPAPLNTAIIAYQETYYVPAVAEPGNFPHAKEVGETISQPPITPISKPKPQPTQPTPPPPPSPIPPSSPENPYLVKIEPILNWLRMDLTLNGEGSEGTRTFSYINIDREYWKILYESYWISLNPTLKTPVEADYFKLEVYEEGTDKLIFSVSSGTNEWFHGSQTFKKAGKYYFKTYTKPVSKYEMNFLVSPTLAK